MNNSRVGGPAIGTPLGPLPAVPDDASRMSDSRGRVVTTLQEHRTPMSLAQLSAATGLHVNTLREHLDSLEARAAVRRLRSTPKGRGRPASLYESVDAPPAPGVAQYAGLASSLAAAIHRTSPTPGTDAVEAGMVWGRDLARAKGERTGRGDVGARRQVVELLDDMGFAPRADARATTMRLTRCPLLDAARRHPDVVCGVHLGIVRGALQEWEASADDVELLPFSDPGFCRLHLAARPRRPPPA